MSFVGLYLNHHTKNEFETSLSHITGMNEGFCESLPAEFQVESVRIYQNRNDSRQYVGCNPPEYPTTKFIKAHEFKYVHFYHILEYFETRITTIIVVIAPPKKKRP